MHGLHAIRRTYTGAPQMVGLFSLQTQLKPANSPQIHFPFPFASNKRYKPFHFSDKDRKSTSDMARGEELQISMEKRAYRKAKKKENRQEKDKNEHQFWLFSGKIEGEEETSIWNKETVPKVMK